MDSIPVIFVAAAASAAVATFLLVAYLVGNPLPWIRRHWVPILLVVVAILALAALWFYQVALLVWFKTQTSSWNYTVPSLGTVEIPSLGDQGMQALFAVLAALMVVLLLVAFLRGPRAVFTGWGLLLTLLFAATLVATLFFFGPHIAALAKEAPDWAARTGSWALSGVVWALLWIGLIFAVVAGIIALWRSGVSVQEKLAGTAALIFVFAIGRQVLLNYDGSRHTYASAPPRSEWGLAVAPTSPCDSREVAYVYEASKPARPFNPAGQCGPVLWHSGHCIWAQGYRSSTPVKVCHKPGGPMTELPLSTEYVWSADGYAFKDKIRLDPPRNTTFINLVQ